MSVEVVEEAAVHAREVGRARLLEPRCPAAVSSALNPRRSVRQRARSTEPARTSRSTSRVNPLWLSSTAAARSDIRIRCSGARGERQQDLVLLQREVVREPKVGIELSDERRCGRGAARARPRPLPA